MGYCYDEEHEEVERDRQAALEPLQALGIL